MTEPSLYNHFIKRRHISRTCLMDTRPRWKGSLWQEPFVPSWIPQQFLPSFPDTEGPRKSPCAFQLEWRIMGMGGGLWTLRFLLAQLGLCIPNDLGLPGNPSWDCGSSSLHTWGHWDHCSQPLYSSGLSVMGTSHNSFQFIYLFPIYNIH